MYGREATTADRKGFTRDPSCERLGKFEKTERFANWGLPLVAHARTIRTGRVRTHTDTDEAT